MKDLIYNIDEHNRTIKCTVVNCKKDFEAIVDNILSLYPAHLRYFYKFIASYYCNEKIKNEYTGKAVCLETDNYNERYGMDLARTKAILKRENAFQSTLDVISRDIDSLYQITADLDRSEILDKHFYNFESLMDSEMTLVQIHKLNNIGSNIEKNEYTPHCCSLCYKTFINYKDDSQYEEHEKQWRVVNLSPDKKIEICTACSEKILENFSKNS